MNYFRSGFRTFFGTFVLFAMLAFLPDAHAIDYRTTQGAGFDQLTESEKAEVLKIIADKSAAAKVDPTALAKAAAAASTPAKVDDWLNIGERIGKMIGGAAKEVGVAVNDFVKTPVGMVAMALIVWHYMGDVVVHVFGGLMVLSVGCGFLLYFVRKQTQIVTEYDTEKKDIFGRSVLKQVHKSAMSDDNVVGYLVCLAILLVASLITIFTY